jgi:hypothetical protein
MRNRAKCRLCDSIIESFHSYDHIECKCGEISINGGPDCFKTASKDPSYKNFIRVDDEDNEIVVKVLDRQDAPTPVDLPSLTRDDYLKMLDDQIKTLEGLPQHAMYTPVTHYDLYSSLLLLSTILRAEN